MDEALARNWFCIWGQYGDDASLTIISGRCDHFVYSVTKQAGHFPAFLSSKSTEQPAAGGDK